MPLTGIRVKYDHSYIAQNTVSEQLWYRMSTMETPTLLNGLHPPTLRSRLLSVDWIHSWISDSVRDYGMIVNLTAECDRVLTKLLSAARDYIFGVLSAGVKTGRLCIYDENGAAFEFGDKEDATTRPSVTLTVRDSTMWTRIMLSSDLGGTILSFPVSTCG